MEKIAESAFMYDRFHLDPKIPKEKSDELYKKWTVNCCKGLVDEVIICASAQDDKPLGFIACKIDKSRHVGIIDLIAVSKNVRRKKIGSGLINAALNWFKREGVDIVEVSTQLTNTPAINFYLSADFKPHSSKVTFHKWLL